VGFRFRKSIKLMPGVRLNFSKSGVGVSAGVRGFRVTQRADGTLQRTVSIPGTGISNVETLGSSGRRGGSSPSRRATTEAVESVSAPTSVAAPPHASTVSGDRPGWFASQDERALYDAVLRVDGHAADAIGQRDAELSFAASVLAGCFLLGSDPARSLTLLEWVWQQGRDPAADPFVRKYVRATVLVAIAPGITATCSVDRTGVGLALAELYQASGRLTEAFAVIEQVPPSWLSAVSWVELASELDRHQDVIDLTNSVTNQDDLTALLCVYRGVALRDLGHPDAARAAFREALRIRSRHPQIRCLAWVERARCYAMEGKRSQARQDLERVLAVDASFPGITESLAALS